MLRFACSHCGIFLKAPDDKAGTMTTCPKCRRFTSVPEKHDIAIVDESQFELEVETTDRAKKTSDLRPSKSLLFGISIVGGLLVVSLLACAVAVIVGPLVARRDE